MLGAIAQLASLPNCSGFLSVDVDNYPAALRAFAAHPDIFGMAILQDRNAPLVPGLKEALEEHLKTGKAINFPRHHGGHHVKEQTDPALKNCPQITTDALPLVTNKHEPKPCQTCAFCLPTGGIR